MLVLVFMRHAHFRVTGRVQGVFFRDFVKDKADTLGVFGFIRNEPDLVSSI